MRLPVAVTLAVLSQIAVADLVPEPIPNVVTLSDDYPDTWVYVNDLNFSAGPDGRVVVLDVAAENRNYKGSMGAAHFSSFIFATARPELYVAETYYERGTRGKRMDMITIYDRKNLSPVGEIPLPGGKRLQIVTHRDALHLIDNERLALVSNFSPAASVTIVDVAGRKVLGEVQTPACSLTYPTGSRGFSTLCGNGTMATYILNEDGSVKSQSSTAPFNDIENDALFSQAAMVGGVAYFPTFTGRMQPIDLSTDTPEVLAAWPLVSPELTRENWRPGGLWPIDAGAKGSLYVLMHADGKEGTHKNGGSEVWVFDPKAGTRLNRIKLTKWGVSIAVTHSAPVYLVVTNTDMELDVYNLDRGQHERTIGGHFADSPLLVYAHP